MGFLKDRLENNEIREELRELRPKITEERINDIIQQFWFRDFYNSLISFPPYLEHLKKFLQLRGNRRFPRSEFYEFFLGQIVGKRDKKLKALQKVAVAMELMQINDLPIKDFQELLKKLKISPTELNIETLIEKNLLKWLQEENKPKGIGFYHHTIQEFFAASYILNTKDPLKTSEPFMVLKQEKVVAFKPSWYGALRFLFESKKAEEFIRWIAGFASKYTETVDDAFSDIITSIDPQIVPDLKTKIFELVYGQYFDRQLWLPVWARHQLGNFCTSETLGRFKKDIKPTNNKTETFVHQGNVAAIIDGILQNSPRLLTSEERLYWKKKLVVFANDDNKNGVLQRHSLDALINYQDASLISKVKKPLEHEDMLVREAFLQFCYKTDPNNSLTIDYLVESIKQGFDIYGRHGLYEITSKKGVIHLLEKFIRDEKFLKRFLDRESIFNAEEEKGDQKLLDNIQKVADSKTINLLKKLISTAFSTKDIYDAGKSYFLQQIAFLIQEKSPNYLMEILDEISKNKADKNMVWNLLYNYRNLFAFLIQKKGLIEFFDRVSGLHESGLRIAEGAIYGAKNNRGETGKAIFDFALAKKLVPKPPKEKIFEKEQEEREEGIYKEFKKLLEPEPGKYFPSIFQFYVQNKDVIDKRWKPEEKKRLVKLAIEEGLEKIDPKKIKVKIPDKNNEGRTYKISTVASYYGDILKIGQILFKSKLKKYRQNIINFIPYAYFEDQETILEIIRSISDRDLVFVNKVYQDKKDDRRYLLPDAYIYIVGEYIKRGCKLNSPQKVLKTFISDKNISQSDQASALEKLGELTGKSDSKMKAFFAEIFKKSEDERIKEVANAVLIRVFKDEEAIGWRFCELKRRIHPFIPPKPMQAHSVGPLEDELGELHFAKPLIELGDAKYLPKFLDLLQFSFEQLKEPEEKQLRSYINYLWRIVITFVDKLKEKGSFDPVVKLEEWVEENAKFEESNWFKGRIDELYKVYIDTISMQKTIDETILKIKAMEEK